MVIELDESEGLTEAESTFRLKGKTRTGKRWNQEYERLIAEYEMAVADEDPGWAASTAAEIRKTLGGVQRLAEATRTTAVETDASILFSG